MLRQECDKPEELKSGSDTDVANFINSLLSSLDECSTRFEQYKKSKQ